MTISIDAWYTSILSCPDCGRELVIGDAISCTSCDFASRDLHDLRPDKPKPAEISYSRLAQIDFSNSLGDIDTSRPSEDFDGPAAQRDSRGFMKMIGERCTKGSTVLDLGCGPRDQAAPFEWLGYDYVGVDYSSGHADFLADAHSLPFKDESFDCIFSYAVLEHLHQPFIAIDEINRVLKKGGIYVGTVSQGEPFHASYFHHTAWGFLSLISQSSTIRAERLWASMDTLRSLSRMGRYPRVIQTLVRIVDVFHQKLPFLAPRKMAWTEKEKEIDALYRAGSVCFMCRKLSNDKN